MIIVAALEAVALVAVVFFLTRMHREQTKDRETIATNALAQTMSLHAKESQSWAQERRELLNRIQAPNHLPVTVPEGWERPEEDEPDESALVGSIVYDDEYGIEDE